MHIHLLAIAHNMQKRYTLTGIQGSIFVAHWRVIAPNGLGRPDEAHYSQSEQSRYH